MSTVTVVATVEASNVPPRVRLNVTDTGTSPAILATTVTRLNPDGRIVQVRTFDGNPLILTTSGSNRTGVLYDYEMPYGAPVSYSTVETPGSSSASVTVTASSVWLVHPGIPALSMPVELVAGSLESETLSVNQGVFRPMGRTNPVIVTDGTRQGGESSITVETDTLPELAALKSMLQDAGTLLLNAPAQLGLGIDTNYIAVGDVTIRRPSDVGTSRLRHVVLPFNVVDMPVGGSQATRTYTDVLAQNVSYAAIRTKYATYSALLAGP